ncbi:MAG TPA: hypothetical protein VN668_05920 [Stellaceae bacterium]|nr:hypothetical protein [Stellaceae bacterium]
MRALLAALLFSLPAGSAAAQTVNLYCTNPQAVWQYGVDIDYGAGTVTWRLSAYENQPHTIRAQINEHAITWSDFYNFTLNRVTGVLTVCGENGGCHFWNCQRTENVKPKF